tara:strand:- start:641 stop:805 length:165 start_codon:yes stop_codon:yes gene_type:complete
MKKTRYVKLHWIGKYESNSMEEAIKMAEDDFINQIESVGYNLDFVLCDENYESL